MNYIQYSPQSSLLGFTPGCSLRQSVSTSPQSWTAMSEEINKEVSAPGDQEEQGSELLEPQLAAACNNHISE